MLKQLRISNIILIEFAEINFGTGLNVLSGETGSGKSAIMNALNLITGERADTGMIRRGSEKGVVEAIFDIDLLPAVKHLLDESGIDHEPEAELIIRREIQASGKSRAFINNRAVQLTLLRQISELLLNIVGQHANRWLLSTDKHREIIDIFGSLETHVSHFSKSWAEENGVRRELEALINGEALRLREIETCRMELEELEEAKLREGEDEELFSEYSLLANAEERAQKVNEIVQTLSGERVSVIALLNRQKATYEQLLRIDPSLAETAKSFENATLELQEIAYTMRSYLSHIENNPARAAEVNERLTLIARLKRKFGSSVAEIQSYQEKLYEKLTQLENADTRIEMLQAQLKELTNRNQALSADLTHRRSQAAKHFEKELTTQLRSLNMPKVEFIAEIQPQKRTSKGDDFIEFYLIPNVGEHKIPIKECASGGELSRTMLSIQTLLAGKEHTPTLIFDEIDANIGGETATIVGSKLSEIGRQHQVLCITHFPQVAKKAQHHIQISKKEENGRTFSVITMLEGSMREKELSRMLGNEILSSN